MVGRNILEHPSAKSFEILSPASKELNLLDTQQVNSYVAEHRPEIIIHSAGIVGGIQANIDQPVKFLVENMQMGLNIIMAAHSKGIKRFINLSSSCIYPKDARNPLSEELILKGELDPTKEGYALAKATSTQLCEYINREDKNYLYKTVIPCNLYGRYDKFDPKHSHMITSVIKKIADAKWEGKQIIDIWGDGLARREFMYAGDLADFIFYAIPRIENMPQNINVGLGHDYTINEYYEVVSKVIGFKGGVSHDLSKPVGINQRLVDTTRLREFGWKYSTSLETGIKKTYDYYMTEVGYD